MDNFLLEKEICCKYGISRKGKKTKYSSLFNILNPKKNNFYYTKKGFRLIDIDQEWEIK